MKINQKRAISDIITTVLIIVLAIGAVALIGSVIIKMLGQGGNEIEKSTDCFALKVTPTGCSLNNATNIATVTAKWAEGNVKLTQIKFVLTDSNGKSAVDTKDVTGGILETTSGTINYSSSTISDSGTVSLTAVGVIQSKSGEPSVCTNSQQEALACTIA